MSIVKKIFNNECKVKKYVALAAVMCAMLLGNVSSNQVYATTATSSASATPQTVSLMKATTPSKTATPKEVSRKVCVNGNYLSGIKVLDQNGTTLLPLRSVAEALNCEVNFDPSNKVAIVLSDNNVIELPLGYTFGVINGTKTAISGNASSVLYNASTYLPVRFVSEALSCSITYDQSARTVFITTDGSSNVAQTAEEPMGAAPTTSQPQQSTPTATTSQPGTAQYCFDNKLPLDQISPENCTKRLTAEQWEELLPHIKGRDLTYKSEHTSVAIIHIPNISTTATTMNGVKLVAGRKDVKNNSLAYLDLTNVRDQVIYYKDGTFKENTNVPKDKDLDDIKFLTFQVIAKESNTPVQILVFPDHFEKDIVPGVDGVPR